MSKGIEDRTLALAGLFQAVWQVQQLARSGFSDDQLLACTVDSLFVHDAQTTAEVYGGIGGVQRGLDLLRSQLAAASGERNVELTRYVITLLHLARKLMVRKAAMDRIADGLRLAERQRHHYGSAHDNVLANLADLYSETVSPLGPRVMVNGEQGYLTNPSNTNRIRTLLLAGIRSAVLWYQSGGNRLQLIFSRKSLLQTAQRLLA